MDQRAHNAGESSARPIAIAAIAAGVGLGLLSFASDYGLRYPWSMVGNIAGTWVVAAFGVGALAPAGAPLRGAAAGLLTLASATAVYYVSTATVWPASAVGLLLPGVLVWGCVGAVAGPGAGAAGAIWRNPPSRDLRLWWVRPVAVGGLAAVLLAEGAFLWLTATSPGAPLGAGVELLVAVAIPAALMRSGRDRIAAYSAMLVLLGAALPLIAVVLPIVFRLAGGGW